MSLIFSLCETVWLDENNHVLKLKRDLKTFFIAELQWGKPYPPLIVQFQPYLWCVSILDEIFFKTDL